MKNKILHTLDSIDEKKLNFLAFSKKNTYTNIKIPKRSWWNREISIPIYPLKKLQRIILIDLLEKKDFLLRNNVTGFRKWKSIKDNAKVHEESVFILKIDLKNFFPSISQDRVYGLMKYRYWLNHDESKIISSICTYKNRLPQWAPTSPAIANQIFHKCDKRIIYFISKFNNIQYTRYADDLTFSFKKMINLYDFCSTIESIIISEGFIINAKKVHLISRWKRQEVTWLVVNKVSSIGRRKYSEMKSLFYWIEKNWWIYSMHKWNKINNDSLSDEAEYKDKIYGYLAHIKNTSPFYYSKLKQYDLKRNEKDL